MEGNVSQDQKQGRETEVAVVGKGDITAAKGAQTLLPPEMSEPEITREQLALGKRLLNWRTLVPLAIVIVALVFVAQKLNIDPQKTWTAIRHANPWLFLAAFVIYYTSFALRAARWRLLL